MLQEQEQVARYREEVAALRARAAESISDMESWRCERDADALEKRIQSIENGSEIMDYYLRTGDILSHYYDLQDQIQQGTAQFTSHKAKPGSILAILEEVAKDEAKTDVDSTADLAPTTTFSNAPKGYQRNQLLNDYLQLEDPAMGRSTVEEYDDPWTNCEHCGNEMIMCLNEANLTCSSCGHQEFILVDSDKPSYKDPPREVCYYAYKKINHFNEWLAQFQAKESTEIPSDVYDEILVQLKKERITNMNTLKPTKLR